MTGKTSAGLLMYRHRGRQLEVLLVRPGGPFTPKREEGIWSIPKGEMEPGEELLDRARIEFHEELGIEPVGDYVPLGSVLQKGGKTVHAWAFEGDLPEDFVLRSNCFELEWPPGSGKRRSFPEVDRAEFFPVELARIRMNPAQAAFLDRLEQMLNLR